MARLTCIWLSLLAVGLMVAGLVLFFLNPDGDVDSLRDDAQSFNLVIFSSVIIGTILIVEILWKNWERKSHIAKKGNGFPDKRHVLLQAAATFWFVTTMLVLQWPLCFFVAVIFYYTVGLILPEQVKQRVIGAIFRFQLFTVWTNPFWKLRFVGKKPKTPPGCVYMSNHLTFADGFITSSMLWPTECKYVATAWVRKIPLAGWMSKKAGDLPIKFVKQPDGTFKVDKEVVGDTMEKAGKYLENGTNIFVFPEGTLSKDGKLKEFKGNAFFNLAMQKETCIVPCAMWGNQTLWFHGEWTPQPGYAEFTMGEPIRVSSSDDLQDVKLKVREAILQLRNSLPLHKATIGQTLSVEDNPLYDDA